MAEEETKKRCGYKPVLVVLVLCGIVINMVIYRRETLSIYKHFVLNGGQYFGQLAAAGFNHSNTTWTHSVNRSIHTVNGIPCLNFTKPPEFKPKGRITVNVSETTWAYLEQQMSQVKPGGWYKPTDCDNPDRVAIIIPYRDRESHLKIILRNLHPFLQRQKLDYAIFVIEMEKNVTFNRALLMNVGFVEASKHYPYQCYVFHDVDLIPEDDRILYTCPHTPRHLSPAYSKFKYKMPYGNFFGGVTALRKEHFIKINGFSNKYFGWGGEDDDLYIRVINKKLQVDRYKLDVGRYRMLVHQGHSTNAINPERFKLVGSAINRIEKDGLNSLQYKVLKFEKRRLYTWILITVNKTEMIKDRQPNKEQNSYLPEKQFN